VISADHAQLELTLAADDRAVAAHEQLDPRPVLERLQMRMGRAGLRAGQHELGVVAQHAEQPRRIGLCQPGGASASIAASSSGAGYGTPRTWTS
jgi:hypothetical protein